MFISLGYTPTLFLFIMLLKLFQLQPFQLFHIGSCVFLTCPYSLFFLYFLFYFLHCFTFYHYKLLHNLVFSLPQTQTQPFHQGALIPFIGEWYIETRSGHQMCLLLLWCHSFQAVLVDRHRKYMYVYQPIYTHISMLISVFICLYFY